jgi:outer membrane protein assembly factor BamB
MKKASTRTLQAAPCAKSFRNVNPVLEVIPGMKNGRPFLILPVALSLLCALQSQVSPAELYRKQESWPLTIVNARAAAQRYQKESAFKPFTSPVLARGGKAQRVVVDVTGVESLALCAKGVPTISSAHAIWGDGQLIGGDGAATPLHTLKPIFVQVGWGRFLQDKGYDDKPLSVAGQAFTHGFLAHADSRVVYALDGKYKRLEVWIGINDTASRQARVRFSIEDDSADPAALWQRIRRDFPVESERAELDLPEGQHLGLLALNPALETKAAQSVLKALEPYSGDLRKRLEALPITAKEKPDTARLEIYAQAARDLAHVYAVRTEVKERYPDLARLTRPNEMGLTELRDSLRSLKQAPDHEALKQALDKNEEELSRQERLLVEGKPGPGDMRGAVDALTALAVRIGRYRGWPTFRGDNQRSGISRERLALPLASLWVHEPDLPPAPAWPAPAERNLSAGSGPLSPTQTYDRAYHVVGGNGALYFGSSSDDSVQCLDAGTGQVRWTFVTEGPVRLAPSLDGSRLFAGSDDGFLYCLDAETGGFRWKVRGGPEDRRLPGNERMISRWPVRCGIVVDEAVVYFAAGIFPQAGVYLRAVRAEDGSEVWNRKAADVVPQGYLLASPERLYVPTGRTPFWMANKRDGSDLAKIGGSDSWGLDLVGGCFAVLVDDKLATGPSEDGQIHLFDARSKERLVKAQGRQLIVNGNISYLLNDTALIALDRSQYLAQNTIAERWSVKRDPGFSLVMAGSLIFVGGEKQVAAYNADTGAELWKADLSGRAEGLAVCEGNLLVSTDDGRIHCFGPSPAGEAHHPTEEVAPSSESRMHANPYPADERAPRIAKQAEEAVAAAGVKKGYCLVINAGDGRLAYEIATRSEFQVIGLESNPTKIQEARERLRQAGLYGSRVVMHQGTLEGPISYTKYFANLIVFGEPPARDFLQSHRKELQRLTRPSGGVLAVGLGAEGIFLSESFKKVTGHTGYVRREPLPGGGEWTHFYADPANTACSLDTSIKYEPMEIQWFGRPGPRRMIDRHRKTVAPLVKNGRLFISGDDYIAAVDAYNGTVLWEHDVPDSRRTVAFRNSSNMVVSDDALCVAAGGRCLVFDAQTGRRKAEYAMPATPSGGKAEWGYIARVGDTLLGSATKPGASFRELEEKVVSKIIWSNFQPAVTSEALFALNGETGRKRWVYPARRGAIINPTIAVAGGRVYLLESDNPDSLSLPNGRVTLSLLLDKGARLVALDLRKGGVLWQKPVDLRMMHHVIYLSVSNGTVVVTGSRYVPIGTAERIRYELAAFDATSGNERWRNSQVPDYDTILDGGHGEQVQHPALVGGVVYGPGFACNLSDGSAYSGWKWHKSQKCATVSLSALCAFSRFSDARLPYQFDLATGEKQPLTTVSRPGCWISIIPAGGLILIPESGSGCTCEYPIQTSLALAPVAE